MKAEFIGVGEHWSFTESFYRNLCAFEQELLLLGIESSKKSMVSSDCSALFYALRDAVQRSDILFIIGGVSGNRIAHKVLCGGLSIKMQHNPDAFQSAHTFFENQGLPIPDYLDQCAKLPEGSHALPNSNGPFCGAVLARKNQCILSLPEQPDELFPMLLGSVLPFLANFTEKKICTQSFVVWDSSAEELEKTLQVPTGADYTVATYRIGQDPARHLVRISICQNSTDQQPACTNEIRQDLQDRLQGYAIEDEKQPILQTIITLSLQKKLRIAVAEYGSGHVLADAICALPNTALVYTYDINQCCSEVRNKVFGLPDQALHGLEKYAAKASAYMARGVREVDNVAFGLAACIQQDDRYTLTATDGNGMLYFADVASEELATASALLLYRFIKAYPAPPCEATPLEAIVGKKAPTQRMEKLKVFWSKIKEG